MPRYSAGEMKFSLVHGGSKQIKQLLKNCHDVLCKYRSRLQWPKPRAPALPSRRKVTYQCPPLRQLQQKNYRLWGCPYVRDFDCTSRPLGTINPEETPRMDWAGRPVHLLVSIPSRTLAAMATTPLADIRRYFVQQSRRERGLSSVDPRLPLSPLAPPGKPLSTVHCNTVKRLQTDCRAYAETQNASKQFALSSLRHVDVQAIAGANGSAFSRAIVQLQELLSEATKMLKQDTEMYNLTVQEIETLATFVPKSGHDENSVAAREHVAAAMSMLSGQTPQLQLRSLVQYLLSANGKQQLRLCNRFLPPDIHARILRLIPAALLLCSRIAHLHRLREQGHELTQVLSELQGKTADRFVVENQVLSQHADTCNQMRHHTTLPPITTRSLSFKTRKTKTITQRSMLSSLSNYFSPTVNTDVAARVQQLADTFAGTCMAQRHFVTQRMEGNDILAADPRMLAFEFIFSIMLRKSQVRLVRLFVDSVARKESKCHQMIMGAGKSTVISPLLNFLLLDGNRFSIFHPPLNRLCNTVF